MAIIKDDLKNIKRIIDVIESNPNIIHSVDNDELLRSVQFGNPPQMKHNSPDENGMPYAYVTTADSLQKTSYPFGISSSTNITQISVGYKIVIVADMGGRQVTAEKKLYNLLTLMRTTLTANPTFKDPDSNDDPIFTRSIINESKWNTKTKGTPVQVVEFILIATIGQTSLINIPGIGDINLISDTGDEGRNSTGIHNDNGNTKISKGANVGSRFFEYEYDTTTYESIETLIISDNELALTLKYPGGDRTYNAKLVFQRDSVRFDGIRTVILQADKITV